MNRTTRALGTAIVMALLTSALFAGGAFAHHSAQHHKASHHKHHKVSHHRHHRHHKRSRSSLRPTRIHCGMLVTHSIKVLNDITCPVPSNPGPPGKGTPPFGLLVMGARNVVVDLNGHTLSGPRVPGASADERLGHGVEMIGVQLMHSTRVTVEKGTIRHFDAGIDDSMDTHNVFTHLTLEDNHNYEVVNGAVDYLPPSPTLTSVGVNGTTGATGTTGSDATTYSYEVATTQVANPASTLGDNGSDGHSYTEDSLTSNSKSVVNSATLSSTHYNTVAFNGAGSNFATGYRVLRSINGGPYVWLGTVTPGAYDTNTFMFVDNGQAPSGSGPYDSVSLSNNNVSVDDSCNNGDGIVVDASSYDTVENSYMADNGPFSGVAMVGEFNPQTKSYTGADYNRIIDNTMYHNAVENYDPGFNNPRNRGLSAYCGTGPGGGGMTRGRLVQDSGIRVEGPNAQHNLVQGNNVIGSGFNGIALHSYVCNDQTGPQPNGEPNSFNTINANHISYTGEFTPAGDETDLDGIGWLASGPPNIVCVSPNNTVTNNVSTHNDRDGIFMGGRANSGNTVTGNTVTDNAQDGIQADQGAQGFGNPPNVFKNNTGSGNAKDDGFDGNANCAGDQWSGDHFSTVNQPCVM